MTSSSNSCKKNKHCLMNGSSAARLCVSVSRHCFVPRSVGCFGFFLNQSDSLGSLHFAVVLYVAQNLLPLSNHVEVKLGKH